MKALSVKQPWASLIACGAKRYETRSWATPHRGPLAIHASTRFPRGGGAWLDDAVLMGALVQLGPPSAWPLGSVVAVAVLVECVPTVPLTDGLERLELACGDFAPGRWAWHLEQVHPLPAPVPARGRLGLWEWGEEGKSPSAALKG